MKWEEILERKETPGFGIPRLKEYVEFPECGPARSILSLADFIRSEACIIGSFPFRRTSTYEAFRIFDEVMLILGYISVNRVDYVLRNVETDYVAGLEAVTPTPICTVEIQLYGRYEGGANKLYYALLYENSAEWYFRYPSNSIILANLENEDFNGVRFDFGSLKEPLPTLFRNEIKEEVKEVDKLQIAGKIIDKISREFKRFDGCWSEFIVEL